MFATNYNPDVKLRKLASRRAASSGVCVAAKHHFHEFLSAHARKIHVAEKATRIICNRQAL
jgi:hypothetical protein